MFLVKKPPTRCPKWLVQQTKILKALCLPPMKPPSFICCYSIDSIDAAASFHFAETATVEKRRRVVNNSNIMMIPGMSEVRINGDRISGLFHLPRKVYCTIGVK